MFITKKKARAAANVVAEWYEKKLSECRKTIADRDYTIHEYEKRWKSPDGVRVLNDLQNALNLIREYQRVLRVATLPDPNIKAANTLLDSWGMKPYSNTNRGFQADTKGEIITSPTLKKPIDHPGETQAEKWKREEEEWGEEAYGSGTVRIEAEAVDEGDDKEPGYTRARIRFVDTSEEAPFPSDANTAAEFQREANKK